MLEVHADAAWAQLVSLLRAVIDAAEESEADGRLPAGGLGDLFRLADAAASVVDAPVTIEDANSRVIAYSARQDRTDPARVSTIMGRRVPDDVLAKFRSRGVFRQLSRGRTTIFVPRQKDGTLPRLIVPIRMGGELLGSMWAVVPGPVPEERAAAFADAAPVVALYLLRRRARDDAERRRSAELVRSLLDGVGSPRLAIAELDLDDGPHRVVAIDVDTEDVLGAEGARLALWERITAGVGRRPAVAELHDVLYAVVPDWGLRQRLAGVAQGADRAGRAGETTGGCRFGRVDRRAGGVAGPSRGDARARRTGLVAGPVASHEDAWPVLALHRVAASAAASALDVGPLPLLSRHDEANGTDYVATLYQWLRQPGDPRAAAAVLGIHPNTLRHRMNRIGTLAGVELTDPDVRLALQTQLAVKFWR